jgi:hypothetical protein
MLGTIVFSPLTLKAHPIPHHSSLLAIRFFCLTSIEVSRSINALVGLALRLFTGLGIIGLLARS